MVKDRPSIFFRCDASPSIGSGHVMRCLTLATAMEKRNYSVSFLCSDETVSTVSALKQSGFSILPSDHQGSTDWLIVDHYNLDSAYERSTRPWAKNIFIIDDLANRHHDCDVLLDQTYGRNLSDYKSLVPPSCTILTGSDYALLRPEFLSLRQNSFEKAGNKILVSFGGVNPKGVTELSLSTLQSFKDRRLSIDVVTGGKANGLDAIKNLVDDINNEKFHAATLHIDTQDIATLMADADLCLGAGGTTSWERCCLKLPTIAIELADNQAPTLKSLAAKGAIVNVGKVEDLNTTSLLETISRTLASPNTLQSMADHAGMVCDGRGALRVACYLLPQIKGKDSQPVSIRFANEADSREIFSWQKMPGVRKYARNPEIPTWEIHSDWFKTSLKNPNREMFIVRHNGQNAGIVRLDRDQGENYEVSILISPEFQGWGLGAIALNLLRSYKPFAIFWAEVLEANEASHKLFARAGYINQNDGWYKSDPLKID